MSFNMPKSEEIAKVVREAIENHISWHICETYGVTKVQDLTFTEIQEVMSEYFNQKSVDLNSVMSSILRDIIRTWEHANGRGII
jgi:hypothetical protein